MSKHLRNYLNFAALFLSLFLLSERAWADYCIPDYLTGTEFDDYIEGVELGDISNFTGPGDDWNDYTDLSTTLVPGLTYTITLHNTPTYPEYYMVWIDWDQDEVVEEDEEIIPLTSNPCRRFDGL